MDDVEQRLKEEREGYVPHEEEYYRYSKRDQAVKLIPEFGPLYQEGHVSIESNHLIEQMIVQDCQFGVQVASDGRVWICINGMAWIRFKPTRT